MSYISLLINTCTITRDMPGVQDAYGNPVETFTTHLADQACRIQARAGQEARVGAEVVIADYKLFLEDIDVAEQDRVLVPGFIPPFPVGVRFEILMVEDRQNGTGTHHKECAMRLIR